MAFFGIFLMFLMAALAVVLIVAGICFVVWVIGLIVLLVSCSSRAKSIKQGKFKRFKGIPGIVIGSVLIAVSVLVVQRGLDHEILVLLMERVKLMRKSIAILICIMIMFIASCCNGGTGPEYRYEDFYIQEIHDGYVYVVPEDQYGESDDPDIYAIDIDLFGSQVYESGSKVQVAYSDFDRDDLYGLNAHSVSVEAQ